MSTTSCCFQLVYHLTYHLALIHYHCQKREGVSLQWHQESNYLQLCILTYYYWHCPHDIMCHAKQGLGNRLVSVQPYVCPSIRPQQRRAAGLLLSAARAEGIDRQRRAATQLPGAAARRSAANAGRVMLTAELTRPITDSSVCHCCKLSVNPRQTTVSGSISS